MNFDDAEKEADTIRKAILEFQNNFNTYIKEMDSTLWDRALDYAKTYMIENKEDENE